MNPYATLPGVFGAIFGIFMLLFVALLLVSNWKIYVKMGVPGWKAIIPYYNLWVMIDCLRKPKSWFWLFLLGYIAYMVYYFFIQMPLIEGTMAHHSPPYLLFFSLLFLALLIVLLVYSIKLTHALSKAFGHGADYTVGLILLPIVFLPILAFGPDKFQLAHQKDLAIE